MSEFFDVLASKIDHKVGELRNHVNYVNHIIADFAGTGE